LRPDNTHYGNGPLGAAEIEDFVGPPSNPGYMGGHPYRTQETMFFPYQAIIEVQI
jgi:hypothetical protein